MAFDLLALPESLVQGISPEPNSGCWLWTGGASGNGYGYVYMGGGRASRRQEYTHRLAYRALVGEIPEGLVLDHLCRTPLCCNPSHLEPVPQRINVIRGAAVEVNRTRQLAKTHCPHGHPYSGDNLWLRKDGRRQCKTCGREASRRHYAREGV